MWHSEKVLAVVAKKTGMSIEEIKNTPWSDLEEKMAITEFSIGRSEHRMGHNSNGMPRITRKMFDEDEKRMKEVGDAYLSQQ